MAMAAGRGSCLLVSILLLLSDDIESNPGPAQPTSFNFGCLNVRNKTAAIHHVIADHQLYFLALSESWIRLDDPTAIANDVAWFLNRKRRSLPCICSIVDVVGQQTKRWRRPGCQLP